MTRPKLVDTVELWTWFLAVMATLSVTVLATQKHDFPGGGFSGTILLGESHAAIHTWPEVGRGWAQLVTCGDREDLFTFLIAFRANPKFRGAVGAMS